MLLSNCSCPLQPIAPEHQLHRTTVAGSFYPAEPAALTAEVQRLLAAEQKLVSERVPIVLAPHAAYFFSGQIAAAAFRQLSADFERVFILAANHNADADYSGLSVDRALRFVMPGFELPIDQDIVERLLRRPGFVDVPLAHQAYVVEVALPFLRAIQPSPFSIVPIMVGRIDRAAAREAARELLKFADERTAFVFSLDMSHFHPDAEARQRDSSCLDALSRMNADDVARCETDGTQMLLIMNELAALQGLTPRLIGYANSSEVPEGDLTSVVGYGALAYENRFELSAEEGNALVSLARDALRSKLRDGERLKLPEGFLKRYPRLGVARAAFVTLEKDGALRGCIGSLEAHQPLAQDVLENAVHAALHDSRFEPVTGEELAALTVSISVLDALRPLRRPESNEALLEALARSQPGVTLSVGNRTSTYLPVVWEELPDPDRFLRSLCEKQGSPPDCWKSPKARFETYGSQIFKESIVQAQP
ncbi:MAG: AmmeMemoRadiSam system protein A [Myxococcales bacterium]|nr:AmmeMemoRadiSam system protein A [Myxococcales bacterium]